MKQYFRNEKAINYLINSWHPDNFKDTINFKCTPGVGDFMYILSVAYQRSFILQKPITVNLHWFHSKDFLYHFEDPETIIERFEYINNFYVKDLTEVNIIHHFNSDDTLLYYNRYDGYTRSRSGTEKNRLKIKYNQWEFRELGSETVPGKIVMWTQVNNAEVPRLFKRPFLKEEWRQVKELIELQGYDVTEIDYRTPVSEVLYHISTCECTVSYEGMWHYVAKNLHKPMIVLTQDNITKVHTPQALIYQVRKVEKHNMRFFHNFSRRLRRAKDFNAENLKKWRRVLSVKEL